MQIKDICKGVTHLPLPLMRVKGRVKVVTTFDIAFDSNQRCSKAITYLISTLTRVKGRSKMLIHLTSPLIRIKGICKGVTYLTYYLMRIKCGVKAVITFDHTFDTNQRKSKSIFSCSEKIPRAEYPGGLLCLLVYLKYCISNTNCLYLYIK